MPHVTNDPGVKLFALAHGRKNCRSSRKTLPPVRGLAGIASPQNSSGSSWRTAPSPDSRERTAALVEAVRCWGVLLRQMCQVVEIAQQATLGAVLEFRRKHQKKRGRTN